MLSEGNITAQKVHNKMISFLDKNTNNKKGHPKMDPWHPWIRAPYDFPMIRWRALASLAAPGIGSLCSQYNVPTKQRKAASHQIILSPSLSMTTPLKNQESIHQNHPAKATMDNARRTMGQSRLISSQASFSSRNIVPPDKKWNLRVYFNHTPINN